MIKRTVYKGNKQTWLKAFCVSLLICTFNFFTANSVMAGGCTSPTNELCAGATTLDPIGTTYASNQPAGCSPGEGAVSCGGANNINDGSIWYKFTAPADGDVWIGNYLQQGYYPPIVLYGSCGGAEISCNYAPVIDQSYYASGLTGGATYYVDIAIPDEDAMGTTTITDVNISDDYCHSWYSGTNSQITNVTFSDINNTTAADSRGYGDYTGITGNVTQNISYTLSVTFGGSGTRRITGFFDWDQNGTLNDAGEKFVVTASGGIGTYSTSVTVPLTATTGNTRMRVIIENTAGTDIPCSTHGTNFGETEDYILNISAALPPGDCYGVYSPDALGGTVADCELAATAGTGGTDGLVYANGTDVGTSVAISGYANITMDNVSCANTNIQFEAPTDATPKWSPTGNTAANTVTDFGSGATLPGGNDASVDSSTAAIGDIVLYSAGTTGRKSVNFQGDETTGAGCAATTWSSGAIASPLDDVTKNLCEGKDAIVIPSTGCTWNPSDITVNIDITVADARCFSIRLFTPTGQELSLEWGNSPGWGNPNCSFNDAGAPAGWTGGTNTTTFAPFGDVNAWCSTTPDITSFGAINSGTAMDMAGTWQLEVERGDCALGTATWNSWSISVPNSIGYVAPSTDQTHAYTDFVNMTMDKPTAATPVAPANICSETAANFSSPDAGTAGYTYLWTCPALGTETAPTIASSTLDATDITFHNASGGNLIYTVTLTITSECCGALAPVTKNITVYPDPSPNPPTVVSSAISKCFGGSQDLQVSSPDASYNYQWFTVSSGGSSIGSGDTYTVNPVLTGANTYYVESTTGNGCISSSRTLVTLTGTDVAPTVPDPSSGCAPGNITATVTSPVSGATYSWYSDASLTTLLQSSTAYTYDIYVPGPAPNSTTVYVTVTESGCTETTAYATTVADITSSPASVTWDGSTDTDWFTAANWTPGCVPTKDVDVIIPTGATSNCEIKESLGGIAECKDLTMDASGVTFTLSESKSTLEVNGNWTNNNSAAAFDATTNDGSISFLGTGAQTIGGSASTTFHNLKINNTISGNGGVTINTDATVEGDLNLLDGHLIAAASGRLTLGSSATVSPNDGDNKSGGSASFVSGFLTRVVNTSGTAYPFPLGSSADNFWRPMTITGTDATSRNWTIEFKYNNPETATGHNTSYDPNDSIKDMNTAWWYDINHDVALGTNGIDVKMFYEQADVTWSDENYTYIGHWCGTCDGGAGWWNSWNRDDASYWSRSAADNWVAVSGADAFSGGGAGGGNAPTPIDLLYFGAEYNKATKDVDLEWSTASETNNDYFTVEKSHDAIDFNIVVTVPGAGNSNQTLFYQSVDIDPYKGVSYYRLKQTDYDGQFEYSNLVTVKILEDLNFSVHPNPASDYLELVFGVVNEKTLYVMTPEYNAEICIFDAKGRKIYSKKFEGSFYKFNIDVSNFRNGLYLVTLSANNQIYDSKFVVEK